MRLEPSRSDLFLKVPPQNIAVLGPKLSTRETLESIEDPNHNTQYHSFIIIILKYTVCITYAIYYPSRTFYKPEKANDKR